MAGLIQGSPFCTSIGPGKLIIHSFDLLFFYSTSEYAHPDQGMVMAHEDQEGVEWLFFALFIPLKIRVMGRFD